MDTNGARPGWSLSFRVPRSAKRPERNHDGHELVSRPNVWWTPRRRGGRVVERAPSSSGDTGGSQHTLVLTPANAEALDTLVSGITGAHNDYVYVFASPPFGAQHRDLEVGPGPGRTRLDREREVVRQPDRLARFEQDAGSTNKSTIRLEGHAAYGVERTGAAVRIAAS
jgi:hypothetical protein